MPVSASIAGDFAPELARKTQEPGQPMTPATLRAGLRRALKGNEDVRMAQRGEETFLVRMTEK